MPTGTRTFRTLAEYVGLIDALVREWTPRGAGWYLQPWFRGHARADWKLEPGACRMPSIRGVGAAYYDEKQLLEQVKLQAPRYLERMPRNDWEWSFLMQHHGLPTRLLDWTESAFVALYFALRDHGGADDAAVWAISPWWVNKLVFGEHTLFASDDPRALAWSIGGFDAARAHAPIAVRPSHESARIQAQRGVFTIHGTKRDGLDVLARSGDRHACIRKLILPARAVEGVQRELSVGGITESTVFPELPGLCRELKRGFFGV